MSLGGRRSGRGRGRGRGRGGPAATAGLRDLRQISPRGEQPQVLDEALREGIGLRVALQVPDGIRATDRVRLAQQVVAEPNLRVRIGAADLGQR